MSNIPLNTIKFPGLNNTYTVPQIDDTLSVTGKAADAKAVSDTIADIVDDTLSVTGKAADAKAAGDQITELKSALISYQKNVGAEIDFVGTASVANQDVTIGQFEIIQGHKYDVSASVASGLAYSVYVYFKNNGTTVAQINLPQGTSEGSRTFTANSNGVIDVMFHPTASVSTVCNVFVSDQNGVFTSTENLAKRNEENIGAFNGFIYNLTFEQGAIGGNGAAYNSAKEIRTKMVNMPPSRYSVNVNGYRVYVFFYDKNGTWQSGKNIWAKTSNFTFEVTDEGLYARFVVNLVNGNDLSPIDNAITLKNEGIYDEFVSARGEFATLGDRFSSIEDDLIPSYFTDAYLSDKITEICENAVVDTGSIFAFITDVHLEENSDSSKYVMKYLLDRTPIPFVMFGGDVPTAYSAKSGNEKAETLAVAQEWAEWVNYWGAHRVYQMRGNHDYVKDSQSDNALYYNMPNGGVHQFVSSRFSPVVHGNEADKNYYFFDNEVQKIRYIVLDGHTYNANYPRVVTSWIYAEQSNWLVDVLSNSDEYNIVILSHEACDSAMSSYAANLAIVQTIVEAFKGRTTVHEYAGGWIDADFTNATGELICVLSGHSHKDESHVSNGVLAISTTCDACYNNDPNVVRTQGTISESAFDVFSIDTTEKTIKTVRIGAGSNRGWNYSTGQPLDD